ncbi:MAG: hypothetical protein AAFV53_41110 [Myxococcota bacterium]
MDLLLASAFRYGAWAHTSDVILFSAEHVTIEDRDVRAPGVLNLIDETVLGMIAEGTLRCDRSVCTIEVEGEPRWSVPRPDPTERWICVPLGDGTDHCVWLYIEEPDAP